MIEEKQIMVSIRCFTYNHEPYIRQCLEGFVMQKTNFKFEAIVHDDASTDGTAAIIREFAEKYPDIIKPLYETENQYSKHDGSLRRIMDANMRGKYIAMCEGDDYWIDPLKLQKQVDFMETHQDYVLIHTAFKGYLQYNRKIISNHRHWSSGNVSDKIILGNYNIGTLTVMIRHSTLQQVPHLYENQNFLMGDLPLWIELSAFGKIKYLDDETSVYRRLEKSASHSNDFNKEIDFIKSAIAVRKFYADEYGIKNINFEYLQNRSLIKLAYYRNSKELAKSAYLNIINNEDRISLKLYMLFLATQHPFIKYFAKLFYKAYR